MHRVTEKLGELRGLTHGEAGGAATRDPGRLSSRGDYDSESHAIQSALELKWKTVLEGLTGSQPGAPITKGLNL